MLPAAGNEVEIPTRDLRRSNLPSQYHVGHGHIVDAALNVSSQLDLVIADGGVSPILYKAKDGSEFFPYEGVYAFGEIKATYYKNEKPIHGFVETISTIQIGLHRARLPMTILRAP